MPRAAPPYKFKATSSSVGGGKPRRRRRAIAAHGGRSLRVGAAYALITAFDSQLPSIYRKKCPFRNFNGPSFFSFFCCSSVAPVVATMCKKMHWIIWEPLYHGSGNIISSKQSNATPKCVLPQYFLPPLPPLPHHPMHFRTHRCNNCGDKFHSLVQRSCSKRN